MPPRKTPDFLPRNSANGKITQPHPRNRHVEDIGAQRQHSAILKDQRLRRKNGCHHNRCRRRTECHREQRAAHQMAAGAVAHREIDHLRGENERAHDAHQRNLVMIEFPLRAAGQQGHGRNATTSIVPHTRGVRNPSGMCMNRFHGNTFLQFVPRLV